MELAILTTTQFIRQAALLTPQVPVAMGKVVKYADVPLVDVGDTSCWLCGGVTSGHGQPVKKAIKPTFTNVDMSRASASKSVCPGCVFCLSFRELRNYSILATGKGLKHPTRPEMRDWLLSPPEPPFVLCVAVSGQKHLTFRAQVAYSRDGYPVQYEETPVYIDRPALAMMLDLIEQLYAVFTKAEILSGQYGQSRIRQFGLGEFQRIEVDLAPYRGSRLFDLSVFVAQKQEAPAVEPEREEKCITTSTPTKSTQPSPLF